MVHYAEGQPTGELTLRTLAMPSDANAAGDIFGGWVMAQMDQCVVEHSSLPQVAK